MQDFFFTLLPPLLLLLRPSLSASASASSPLSSSSAVGVAFLPKLPKPPALPIDRLTAPLEALLPKPCHCDCKYTKVRGGGKGQIQFSLNLR